MRSVHLWNWICSWMMLGEGLVGCHRSRRHHCHLSWPSPTLTLQKKTSTSYMLNHTRNDIKHETWAPVMTTSCLCQLNSFKFRTEWHQVHGILSVASGHPVISSWHPVGYTGFTCGVPSFLPALHCRPSGVVPLYKSWNKKSEQTRLNRTSELRTCKLELAKQGQG